MNYLNTLSVRNFHVAQSMVNKNYKVYADDEIIKEFDSQDEACAYLEYICRKMCYFSLEQDCLAHDPHYLNAGIE